MICQEGILSDSHIDRCISFRDCFMIRSVSVYLKKFKRCRAGIIHCSPIGGQEPNHYPGFIILRVKICPVYAVRAVIEIHDRASAGIGCVYPEPYRQSRNTNISEFGETDIPHLQAVFEKTIIPVPAEINPMLQ